MPCKAVVILSTLLCSAAAAEAQDNAATLLAKTAARYKALTTYDIKAETTYAVIQNGQSGSGQKKTDLAIGKDGRFRVEQDNGGIVEIRTSDGKTIWKEMPRQKVWSKQEASVADNSGSDDEEESGPTLGMDLFGQTEQSFVRRYTGLARYAAAAQIEKEERLKFNGNKIDCVVVRISSKAGDNRLYIAKESGWVVRHVETVTEPNHARTQITTDFRSIANEPPPAEYFAFTPAKGSKETSDIMLPSERNMSLVGRPAADFTLKTLDGASVHLAELHGKVVLLDFWASWCPPCRRELPTIETLSRKYKDHNVVVLGVNDEDPKTARKFLEQKHPDLATLHDEKRKVHRLYGCYSIPTVMVIDGTGKIVAHFVGERQESELVAALKQAGMN